MARLVFYRCGVDPPRELLRVNLLGSRRTFGRGECNDIVFPDPSLPERQFAIERIGGSCRLKDLSGQRTEVAGELVKQARLVEGREIRVSRWYAVFRMDSDAKE